MERALSSHASRDRTVAASMSQASGRADAIRSSATDRRVAGRDGVSCTYKSACTAVGYYFNGTTFVTL